MDPAEVLLTLLFSRSLVRSEDAVVAALGKLRTSSSRLDALTIEQVFEDLGFHNQSRFLADALHRRIESRQAWVVKRGAIAALELLKRGGARIAAIMSRGDPAQTGYEDTGILGSIEEVLWLPRSAGPESLADALTRWLRRTGAEATACWFVGESQEAIAPGARLAGLRSTLVGGLDDGAPIAPTDPIRVARVDEAVKILLDDRR